MEKRSGRSLLCRLAERTEFADRLSERAEASKARLGVWWRLTDRHVKRCPACRAERAENERLIRMLKQIDRPAAPPSLLPAVMARIAAERAIEHPQHGGAGRLAAVLGPPEGGRRAPRLRRAFQPDPADWGAAVCVLALLWGWAGVVSAWGWLGGFFQEVSAAVRGAMAVVGAHASEASSLLNVGFAVLPPEFEPYAAALVWTAVGFGAALLAPIALRAQARPR